MLEQAQAPMLVQVLVPQLAQVVVQGWDHTHPELDQVIQDHNSSNSHSISSLFVSDTNFRDNYHGSFLVCRTAKT